MKFLSINKKALLNPGRFFLLLLLIFSLLLPNFISLPFWDFFPIQEAKAAPGVQIKTAEFYVWQFAPDALTATAATTITSGNGIKNTAWPTNCGDANDAAVAINLPESGIVVRKAWVEWSTDLEGLANSTNQMRFCRAGATSTAVTTSFTNVRSVDGTENFPVYLTQDVTSQIAAGSQTYYFNGRLTGSTRATDNAKLFITYEYDDTSATQLKTVKYFVGCNTIEDAAGTTNTYTVNPKIPESGVAITQSFIEYSGQAEGNDATDGIIFAGFNGTNPPLAAGIDDANRSTHEWRTLWNTATSSISLNASNTITLVNNNDPQFLKCAEWILNYTYTSSATELRTVRYAIGQDLDALNHLAQETIGSKVINLPDLTLPSSNVVSAWLHFHGEPDAVATVTPQVNITGAAAPSTGPAFNLGFKLNTGMVHIVWDIKTFFNDNWANGDTLTAAGQCSAAGACDAFFVEFYITYAYNTNQATGIKTVGYLAGQDITQKTAGTAFTTSTLSTFLPETGVRTFRNGGTVGSFLAGGAAADMTMTITIDSAEVAGTDTISHVGSANAEEHDHRSLLPHISGGQLTNNSQSNITLTLNHTSGTHLSGAITYTTYEYPIPQPAFEQSSYRLFDNADSTQVGSALTAGQNASTTLSSAGQNFRIRLLLHVSGIGAPAGANNLKLQFATSSPGGCGYDLNNYTDVATAAGNIRFLNNAGPADGVLLTATGTDPIHDPDTVIPQTYEEANNFTATSTIGLGQDGKWDFALDDFSAPADTTYCFRVVKSDNSLIATSTSTKIPEVRTAAAGPTISCSTDVSSTSFGTLTAASVSVSSPNASTTMSCSNTSSGCALYVADAGNGSNPGLATTSPAYLIPSNTATLSAGTEGYGIQATTTAAGSGGTLTVNSIYNKINNDVGGLLLSTVTLASSTIDASGREMVATHKAAISSATLSGSYADTITYSCLIN